MATASSSLALKEYLKRYQSSTDEIKKSKKKKKKKEKPKPQSTASGVIVFDNDPVWQKPVQLEDSEEEGDSVGDGMPQIEEDIEVKRMKRLEAIRSLKPYHSISEDGSGWIPIPKPFKNQEVDAARGFPVAELSPARKSRKEPADDLSPPRRFQGSTEVGIYPLSRTRKGSSEDLSPPRRTLCSPAIDLSPPRKATKRPLEDLSPPRRSKKHSLENTEAHNISVLDLSATGRGHHRSSESSGNLDLPLCEPTILRNKELPLTKETRMGGLLSAREMREEIHMKKKDEKSRFAAMDPLLSGRGAEAVHRDKEGKKISKEKLEKPKEEKKEQKPLEWGKGLAQKRDAQQKGKELELEKERPFARLRDDPELNKMLKEEIRWGDTMAPFIKRKTSALILEDLGENEKMKESGFVIPQAVPSHSWLKRGLDFLPNRYGIRPGRHWDGVDRSNGYEKELYKRQNEKRANETEAYLWSVSDM